MEDIISSEENVIPIYCENHCYKDINEGNVNSFIKRTCSDNVFKYISDITESIFVRRV